MTKLRPNFRKSRKIRTNAYKCGIFQPHITGVFFGALQGVDVDYPQFFVVGPPGYPSTQFLFTLLLILILCTLDAGGSSNRLQRSMVCYLSLSQAPELNIGRQEPVRMKSPVHAAKRMGLLLLFSSSSVALLTSSHVSEAPSALAFPAPADPEAPGAAMRRPCGSRTNAGHPRETQNWVVTSRAGPAADGIDSYTLV